MTQNQSLHSTSLVVVAVTNERALEFVESIGPALIRDTDTGSLEIARISPGFVPGRLPEALISLLYTPQEYIHKAQIEYRLTIVRVGVTLLQYLDGCFQIGLGLLETSPTKIPQAHLHVTTIVHRIATQGLLVIVEGTPRSMTVLL